MCKLPYMVKTPLSRETGRNLYQEVPCGSCDECYKQRSNQWYIRLHYEQLASITSYFITLTYATAPRSYNYLRTTIKQDLIKFMKRLRKTEPMLKYYAVSEYGEISQRPHYHAIIFNVKDVNNIAKAWILNGEAIGNIHIGQVEPASIKYVTGYLGKKIGIPFTDYDDREKEFSIMSKGLGIRYVEKTGNFHKTQIEAFTYLNGIKYKLPRYYKDKVLPILTPKQKQTLLKNLKNEKITEIEYQTRVDTSARNKAIRTKMSSFAKDKYVKDEDTFIASFDSIEAYNENKQSSLQNAQEKRNQLRKVLNH